MTEPSDPQPHLLSIITLAALYVNIQHASLIAFTGIQHSTISTYLTRSNTFNILVEAMDALSIPGRKETSCKMGTVQARGANVCVLTFVRAPTYCFSEEREMRCPWRLV